LASCITSLAAQPGSTIFIGDDIVLTELLPLLSNHSLTIEGAGYTIDAGPIGVVFEVDSSTLRVFDLELTGAGNAAILGTGSAAVRVVRSAIVGNGRGLQWNSTGRLAVTNSTIAMQSFDGIDISSGTLSVASSTIAQSSFSGIYVSSGSATIDIAGSLIAGNNTSDAVAGDCEVQVGASADWTIVDSVVGDATCGTAPATPGLAGSLLPLTDAVCIAEQCVQHIPLAAGSPALNAGGECEVDGDQRGFPRSTPCDAGSYELVGCSAESEVRTGIAFAHAFWCYNQEDPVGPHQITVLNDIEVLAQLVATTVPSVLTVDGQDNTISLSNAIFGAGSGELHVARAVLSAPDGSFTQIGAGSGGTLRIEDSVTENLLVVAFPDSRVEFRNSIATGSARIAGAGGDVLVVGSEISASDEDGLIMEGGQLVVLNSTVAAPLGAAVSVGPDSQVYLAYSTIEGSNVGLLVQDDGSVEAYASLLAENETDCELAPAATTTLSQVFAEDASCPGAEVAIGGLQPFETTLCETTTPMGCTGYRPLALPSAMIDVVDCALSVPVGFAADGSIVRAPAVEDQRGALAAGPTGSSCDVGAVEMQYSPGVCRGAVATIDLNVVIRSVGTPGPDVVVGTPGPDTFDLLEGNDLMCAGDGADVVVGGDGDDRLYGEGDRDIMRGNAGVDTIEGGAGNDRLLGGIDGDTLIGGDGDDYLGGFGGADTINGGPGNETIFGGFGADIINAGPGDDKVFGLVGNDTINGGAGNDELNGDRGNDIINGGAGNDLIRGGNANDVLDGGAGDDSVNGGRADDQLSGGDGTNDECVGNKQINGDTADGTCERIFGVP
jgi:hypothetical protein